ncbi:MAG TPA: hypothetical protein VE077_04635 [Candidatus Methylomirabilis sp.]|nr:hypothetical protein [Candidatus Methylomirabilis sp.]
MSHIVILDATFLLTAEVLRELEREEREMSPAIEFFYHFTTRRSIY